MLEQYTPKMFCREFVEGGFGEQLPLVMATVKGVKPVSDVWLSCEKFDLFKEACSKYKLFYYPNGIFIEPEQKVLESTYLKYPLYRDSTTKVLGIPFDDKKIGKIHTFISKDEGKLLDAVKYGWYPQMIRGILTEKPPLDLLKFGEVLGYPQCCINFFNKSHKREIPMYYNRLKNTETKPSIYCNNILNHISYSYIHHSSCSLDCKETIKWAKEIERAIEEEEPEYAKKIREALKLPIITWGEKKSYVFDGYLNENVIDYKDFKFIGDERDNIYLVAFSKGNRIVVTDKIIYIYNGTDKISEIKKVRKEFGFALRFE